jgi:hypothetical protein
MDGHRYPSGAMEGRSGLSCLSSRSIFLPIWISGSAPSTIARQGIETVIDHDLATNPGLRRRYEEALNELQRKRGVRPLHVVAKTGTAQADTD